MGAEVEAGIAPWLAVADGERAIEFYSAAFGALERYRLEDDAGRPVVVRMTVGGASFWLQEDRDVVPAEAALVRMILTVPDPEAVHSNALLAGAREMYPVTVDHGWLVGRLVDPFGHHWEVGKPLDAAD